VKDSNNNSFQSQTVNKKSSMSMTDPSKIKSVNQSTIRNSKSPVNKNKTKFKQFDSQQTQRLVEDAK